MNVLSLFDGISCGQLALQRAGIPVENYFASEIDPYTIQITQKNYPATIQLGDVTKWKNWDLPKIDLLIGGSPCQGFSISGKGLNFNDPRSRLFFEFVKVLKYYRPKFFMLENVKMRKDWQNIISDYLGVQPVLINSALVSAQNRERLYWINFPVMQPEDKNIIVKDILQQYPDPKYFMNDGWQKWWAKNKEFQLRKQYSRYCNLHKKSLAMTARQYASWNGNFVLEQLGSYYKNNGDASRIYSVDKKARTLKGEAGGDGAKMGLYEDNNIIRKLTPIECERLQTLPDNYTEGISEVQRYKSLGNGWTVDVVAHIFECMKLQSDF